MAGLTQVDEFLVKLTDEFTHHDWRKIQTKEYLRTKDSYKYADQRNKFILDRVIKYIKQRDGLQRST
jgi:hypothetical protein